MAVKDGGYGAAGIRLNCKEGALDIHTFMLIKLSVMFSFFLFPHMLL